MKEERGFVVPLVAVLIPLFLAMIGLMVDVGIASSNYFKLANAVDAAAFAALDSYDEELWEEEQVIYLDYDIAKSKAQHYLHENLATSTLKEFHIISGGRGVRVVAEVISPIFFMKMFGMSDRTISSTAEAELKDP